MNKFKVIQEFTDAIAARFWSSLCPVSRFATGLEQVLEEVWQADNHRLPSHPERWEIWRTRVIVSPVIHAAKPKHPLLLELMSRPGQPVLVADSQLAGRESLHYCVALDNPEELVKLITRQFHTQAVIRQYDERYLFAAPVKTFFNNHAI